MHLFSAGRWGLLTLWFASAALGSSYGEERGKLQAAPGVVKAQAGWEISFALSAPNDVTVRIVDGKGEFVRHLASGVVGLEKAATPFQANALAQKLTWDGKDDAGNEVAAAGCKVALAVGMHARFDKFILGERNGYDLGKGNVVKGTGDEYLVTQAVGVHQATTRIFNSQGKFVRQFYPFGLGKPKEKIEKFFANPRWGAEDWDGNRVPNCINHNSRYWFSSASPVLMATDGTTVGIQQGGGDRLLIFTMDSDGFPAQYCWYPPWYSGNNNELGFDRGNWQLAAGNEGDFYLWDKRKSMVGRFRAGDMSVLEKKEGTELPVKPLALTLPEALKAAGQADRTLSFPHFLRTDSKGRLFVKNSGQRFGPFVESDGEGKAFKVRGGFYTPQAYTCFDAQDNWYVSIMPAGREPSPQTVNKVWKYAPDGKRAKFGDKDELCIESDVHDIKGLFVTRGGDIYVVTTITKWTYSPQGVGNLGVKGDSYNISRVDVYGPDGVLKKKSVIRSRGLNDVAVDRGGNIYAIEGTPWHGAQASRDASKAGWPGAYAPASKEEQALDPATQNNKRFSLLGKLMKFAPGGGAFAGDGGAAPLWTYSGVSGVSPGTCGAECPAAQICLDADERFWVPDTFMYCVKAVDAAGNLMLRVGKYGNEDCNGGGGDKVLDGTKIVIDPEIPLARPSGLAIWKDLLFISDMYAHRVLRCRLEYAEKKELPLP